MTLGELIEHLQGMQETTNDDARVYIYTMSHGHYAIETDTIRVDDDGDVIIHEKIY